MTSILAPVAKERPILFSAPMVRAILDGKKTQTRRIVKPQPVTRTDGRLDWHDRLFGHTEEEFAEVMSRCYSEGKSNPYGAPGDRLWVRETWMPYIPASGSWDNPSDPGIFEPGKGQIPHECDFTDGPVRVSYKADLQDPGDGWFPSIHMPRWASRITLEVVSVRVERLQDISEEDCVAEGIPALPGYHFSYTLKTEFAELWESINGPGSLEANPWVWVISFRSLPTEGEAR